MSSMDSLSDNDDDDDEARSCLFLVKETAHSFSPILGLALVTLLICLRIAKGLQTHVVQRLVGLS